MSLVKTPVGTIMHTDTHRDLVKLAKEQKLTSMLLQLEPAEPVEEMDLFERPRLPMTRLTSVPLDAVCTFHKHKTEVGKPARAVEKIDGTDVYLCAVCQEILAEDLARSPFSGIDRQVREPVVYESTPLTEETFRQAAEKLLTDPPKLMGGYACHPDEACPTCHIELVREHAHRRCPRCGYRDACCW